MPEAVEDEFAEVELMLRKPVGVSTGALIETLPAALELITPGLTSCGVTRLRLPGLRLLRVKSSVPGW